MKNTFEKCRFLSARIFERRHVPNNKLYLLAVEMTLITLLELCFHRLLANYES